MSENETVTVAEDASVTVVPERKKLKFNQANMTLGDLEDFEEITGRSFNSAMKQVPVLDPVTGQPMRDPDPEAKGRPLTTMEMSMKGMVALVYIAMKKDDPTFTIEDARALKLTEFEMDMADPDAGDTTAPLGEAGAA